MKGTRSLGDNRQEEFNVLEKGVLVFVVLCFDFVVCSVKGKTGAALLEDGLLLTVARDRDIEVEYFCVWADAEYGNIKFHFW